MIVVVLLVSALLLIGAVVALRRPAQPGARLEGNDPARADVVTDADARTAVNQDSWMLGGGGGGGGS